MSENVIYCYSGTGNCLDMAKCIARELGDTDIILMRRFPAVTDASAYKRVGFVFPNYGGGLPGGVEAHIRAIHIGRDAYTFGVVQCAAYMGCGLRRIDDIVGGLDYWGRVSHHCAAIWLFPHYVTLPPTTRRGAQQRAEAAARRIAADVKRLVKSERKPPKRRLFALESAQYARLNRAINRGLRVGDACVGCGVCARLCPKRNIEIRDGRAAIGTSCIGCMTCVQYCPREAINVGRITGRRTRYRNANTSVDDLCGDVIHID